MKFFVILNLFVRKPVFHSGLIDLVTDTFFCCLLSKMNEYVHVMNPETRSAISLGHL